MKILSTIGPATESYNKLKKIINYSKIIRLNSSHNSFDWHKNIIKKIKKIDNNVVVLVDIPGVKPRTGNNINITIKKGEIIKFGYNLKNEKKYINLTKPLPSKNKFNKYFSIDDGKYSFRTIKFTKNILIGKSISNFVMKPKKGLNIPHSVYDDNEQKKTYLNYIKYFDKLKINAIGLSFVQNHELILFLKKKYPKLLLVSKIENIKGLKNCENICKYSDVIMIDRGDLSAEIGDEHLYSAIIKISDNAKKFGKPLIMATENLETLSKNINPTKNDIISLGFSSQVNTDIIMLSEETAISKKWEKILIWLKKFINNQKKIIKENNIKEDIFWKTVDLIRNHTLIIFTKKGMMLDKVFRKNTDNDVFVFTDTKKTKSISQFYKNAHCILTKKFKNKNISNFYFKNIKKYKKLIFKKDNRAFLITISFPKKGSSANSLAYINKNDF